jgi:WD40 repeat protein
MWDTDSGESLHGKEKRHDNEVTVASFFDDDKRIVTASKDGFAKVQ